MARLEKAVFFQLSLSLNNSKMSQQSKSVICFLPSCKFKIVDCPSPPFLEQFTLVVLWFSVLYMETLALLRCGGGGRKMEGWGRRVCVAHVYDLTTMGVKQH